MLLDCHCHLHDQEFFSKAQQSEFLKNADASGVKQIICIGTDPSDSLAARDFAESHANVFWTYGIHPEESQTLSGDPECPPSSKLVAIGEIGLDYHSEGFDRSAQIQLFNQMLQLAKDKNLPVSFHIRDAFDDFFGILNNFPDIRGVVHSFTGNKKILTRILTSTDFYIGVNGLATYSTLPMPPLDRIILETDAPFLTPSPFRGIINQPAYIRNIADWLSIQQKIPLEEVEKVTTENGKRLFRLPDPVSEQKQC